MKEVEIFLPTPIVDGGCRNKSKNFKPKDIRITRRSAFKEYIYSKISEYQIVHGVFSKKISHANKPFPHKNHLFICKLFHIKISKKLIHLGT